MGEYVKKNSASTKHPDYTKNEKAWVRIRDCVLGEDAIKAKTEVYLPRPKGMSGIYADAYDAYLERAHFSLVTSYALSGALGVVISKLPEFNVPSELEYILKDATKDGRPIQQLFLDIIIEIFQTGRVPLLVDVAEDKNEFRFVQYKAEDFINWKTSILKSEKSLTLGVLKEQIPDSDDIFSHSVQDIYRVLSLDENGNYVSRVFGDKEEYVDMRTAPLFLGDPCEEIPLIVAGSISNSFDIQPIPLIAVANCAIQIYRKEADLANSEFLSCNPTLVITGASNDDDIPTVVGSSVLFVVPNEASRVFYTTTDTAALTHVKEHIDSLYEEAIRHGVAILDSRKGVEAAEALRIRQATQSASVYSIYLAALNAIKQGLVLMCKWGGYDEDKIVLDAPASLSHGIPDSAVIKAVNEGFGQGVVPLTVIHRYLVASGLLEQTVGFEDYVQMLNDDKDVRSLLQDDNSGENTSENNNNKKAPSEQIKVSDKSVKESEGTEDQL